MLLDIEKVSVRRLCWYGMAGSQNVQAYGYRWVQNYGILEFRMNNMSPQEEEEFRILLGQCQSLEAKLLAVACDLDTDTAGPWKRNANQLKEVRSLYKEWRLKLCQFVGLEPGPEYSTGSRTSVVV